MKWSFPFALEAVAFFTCACQYSFDTLRYQFIYQVVSEELNFTKSHSVEYCSQNTTSDADEQEVADEVSRWTLYAMFSGYVTCAIGATTFTTWSDRIGRKKAIAFPVVGTLVAAFMQCMIVIYRLPLYTLIITELVYGASGNYSALLSIGSAYLSDTVKEKERGRRYNLLEVFASVGGGIVQIGTGYWMNSDRFVPTSIFIVCCAFLATILIPFIKSTNKHIEEFTETSGLLSDDPYDVRFSDDLASQTSHETTESQFTIKALLRQMMTSWQIYTVRGCACEECIKENSDPSHHIFDIKKERRWRLWFYALSHSIYMFTVNGVGVTLTMFLVSHPVCFTPDLVGAQSGLDSGLIIAAPFFILLLQGYFKLEGQTMTIIGSFARVCSWSLISVARGPVLVFVGTSFAIVYNFTTAFIRSEATRLVSPKEQGAALAVMSGLESLMSILSPTAFLTLYPATLYIFHGFSLAVAALICSVTFVLMSIVWIANKMTVTRSLM